MKRDRNPATDEAERASSVGGARGSSLPGGGSTVEEMSEASFPASDAPATWTWDIPEAREADTDDDVTASSRP